MTREKLPERRQGITEHLEFKRPGKDDIGFAVTFNWEDGGRVREVFALAFKEGADLQSMLHHSCILTSVALQSGRTMAELAHSLGEENPARIPGSIMGLIVRAGVVIDEQRGFIRKTVETEPE